MAPAYGTNRLIFTARPGGDGTLGNFVAGEENKHARLGLKCLERVFLTTGVWLLAVTICCSTRVRSRLCKR